MENKFNVLDPVLVYATIDSITHVNGEVTYSIKLNVSENQYTYVDFIPEGAIQTVF